MAAAFMQVVGEKHYKKRTETRENDFKKLYRFSKENVEWIANNFLEATNETRGGALSPFQKVKIFLRYVADPGFQSGIGEEVGVHQSSVSRSIWFVAEKILNKSSQWIKFPVSREQIRNAQHNWQQKYSFPCAIGALDCTHVRIEKPSYHGDEYINRKMYASINVQATCNSEEKFTSVEAQWPGSVHDSKIWKTSPVYACFHQIHADSLLLADSGYDISPWVMTPFSNPETPQEEAFNRLYASERVIIERCFGQLKRRFPILQYKIRLPIEKIPTMIICCFVLHNVAKHLNDNLEDLEDINGEDQEDRINMQNYGVADVIIRALGQHRREQIAEIIYLNL